MLHPWGPIHITGCQHVLPRPGLVNRLPVRARPAHGVCLAHFVEPHDGGVITGVTERLELVIPCGAQSNLQFALHVTDVAHREFHRVSNAVLPHDDVTRGIRLRVMDAQVRGVHPARTVGRGRGIFRDLEPQVLPPVHGGGDRGAGPGRPRPEVLSPSGSREHGLIHPVEVHRPTESAPYRPLQVGAQRSWRGVNHHHTARH